jgi:hypothetical protein
MNMQNALGGLLVVQVALAAFTWMPNSDVAVAPHKLVDVTADDITSLTITPKPADGQEEAKVELRREGAGWVIASANDYPAEADKVDEVTDALANLMVTKPAATSASSHNQLKVGDVDYSKKIEITANGETTQLLLGAAASNTSHLRVVGDDEVYRAKVSAWTISDAGRSYWDPQVIDVAPEEVTSLTIRNAQGEIQLTQQDGLWDIPGKPEGTAVDQAAVATLASKALKVRMNEPAGDSATDFGFGSGYQISWDATENDQTVSGSYALGSSQDTWTYIQPQDGFVVKVSKSSLESVAEQSIDALLTEAAAEAISASPEGVALPPGLFE